MRTSDGYRNCVDPAVAAEYRRRGWWGDQTLADVVREHAHAQPEALAYIADRGSVTWAEYDSVARDLAARLAAAGLEEGSRMAVLVPDSATTHIAYLAAEQAGITVVGIGTRAGHREVAHLMSKTGATCLLTPPELRGQPAAELFDALAPDRPGLRHVVVPWFEAGVDGEVLIDGEVSPPPPPLGEERRLGPDDLFFLNSTSGTTGLPKCVAHTQNRWMFFHQKAVANGRLGPADVAHSVVPAPFGFGLWTAHFTPTLLGVPTVLTERFDAERTLELIEAHAVTMLACVSTQFIMLLQSPTLTQRDLSSLRVMFTGGEAVPFEKAKAFEERTGCTVLQFFGSNETGLLSGTTLEDTFEQRLTTAGRVDPDMQVRLYDGDRDVTAGGRGQPAGKGPATCLGYLDDEQGNAALYTSDGWMLMGDICTIDDAGYLTVVGRTSDIIIRGGKNISAAQVEDEVSSHPAVALAAAIARADETFGERVCVCVELRPGATLTLEELNSHLEERGTSKELRPEYLLVLDELPRSSGGKVAKGELQRYVREHADAGDTPQRS